MNPAQVEPVPSENPAPTQAREHFAHSPGKISLWTGVLGGPIVWSLQQFAGYAVSRFSSEHRGLTGVHHAVSVVALLLAAGCTLLAWLDWHRLGDGEPRGSEPGVTGRSRFLAVLGIVTSGYFAIVILAQWIPVFFWDPGWY